MADLTSLKQLMMSPYKEINGNQKENMTPASSITSVERRTKYIWTKKEEKILKKLTLAGKTAEEIQNEKFSHLSIDQIKSKISREKYLKEKKKSDQKKEKEEKNLSTLSLFEHLGFWKSAHTSEALVFYLKCLPDIDVNILEIKETGMQLKLEPNHQNVPDGVQITQEEPVVLKIPFPQKVLLASQESVKVVKLEHWIKFEFSFVLHKPNFEQLYNTKF